MSELTGNTDSHVIFRGDFAKHFQRISAFFPFIYESVADFLNEFLRKKFSRVTDSFVIMIFSIVWFHDLLTI